jgi:integrase
MVQIEQGGEQVAANPQPVPAQVPSGFLRDEQYDALAQATAGIGTWLRTMFELCVTYGMRKGELLGLRVRQVNLKEKLITLNPGEPKNGRNLPMTSKVFELLRETIRGKAPEG